MSTVEKKVPLVCERCDKESPHMAQLKSPDNRIHHVCWSCVYRTEKHINVSRRWQRSRRG